MNQQPIRVFLCDDHGAFADGVERWLTPPIFKCAGKVTTGKDCLERITKVDVDMVLLDIRMGSDRQAGIKLAKQLRAKFASSDNAPRIVFLSGFNDHVYLQEARKMGISFLNKDLRMHDILRSLEQIHNENKLLYYFNGPTTDPRPALDELQSKLSPTQGQVACLLAVKGNNQHIADTLGIAVMTINTHLRNIYHALDLSQRSNNREQLIAMVHQSGLLDHLEDIMAQPQLWFGRRRRRA